MFSFFAAATPEGVAMMNDIANYLDFVMTLFFAFGVAFEIPVAVVLLLWICVVDVKYLKKVCCPYVVISCFVVGALCGGLVRKRSHSNGMVGSFALAQHMQTRTKVVTLKLSQDGTDFIDWLPALYRTLQ